MAVVSRNKTPKLARQAGFTSQHVNANENGNVGGPGGRGEGGRMSSVCGGESEGPRRSLQRLTSRRRPTC